MTRQMELYVAAFAGWSQRVADEARPIVQRHATAAYEQIRDGYPVKSGTLRDGLRLVETDRGPMHPSWTVRNDVVYALIFESGGSTLAGAKTPGRVFNPIAVRERRAMRGELLALLERTAPRG